MRDLVATFREEAFLFDEVTVESRVGKVRDNRFRIFYRISRAEKEEVLVETGF